MLCEKQTPIESKLRDLEKILFTRRQHTYGCNATIIFAYESERERESNKHAEMSSGSSGMPTLISSSSSDESGGALIM